ncbi:hypothetical protein ABID30_002415 [Enterococcus rotai]|uniref:WxL domain-containing protein n=1 Tax=Enterococcus rotai TaxID=118060 RepID=A0A0U2NP04_9ENTE|nr:WxL domain-containing protein [Enterococcus rotai]ALS36450.1 hypothetical protein ATZ35_04515 [Enterococcus rotai]
MKNKFLILILLLLNSAVLDTLIPVTVEATSQAKGEMGISFKGLVDPGYGVLDPENPVKEVEPVGDYGKTTGPLRIDYVPNINFNSNKITLDNVSYAADSVQFKGMIAPRGNFIQVSDYRGKQVGWSLQVRQEMQFTNKEDKKLQLDGATLSLDKASVNTNNGDLGQAPVVSKEVISITNIGETYTLAKAPKGTGGGTWSIILGTEEDKTIDNTSTLKPRVDENGKPIISTESEQAIYLNNAISLLVPGRSKKKPGTYTTVLTWIISELP